MFQILSASAEILCVTGEFLLVLVHLIYLEEIFFLDLYSQSSLQCLDTCQFPVNMIYG